MRRGSGSRWRQFHWFRLCEFIWEHRLSVNNQLGCMNIFFSKWHFVSRYIKSERASAPLNFWMPMLYLHYLIYYSQVTMKCVLLLSPFGEKAVLHRFTQDPNWRETLKQCSPSPLHLTTFSTFHPKQTSLLPYFTEALLISVSNIYMRGLWEVSRVGSNRNLSLSI